MKKNLNLLLFITLICVSVNVSFGQENKKPIKLKTKNDTISYIIGNNIGSSFKQNGLDLNTDIVKWAIDDAIKGEKPIFPDSVIKKVMTNFQKEMMAKQDVKKKGDFEKNKVEGDKFLAENKKNKDVVTMPSGLQYKIIKTGTGPKPLETDQVKVNYEGKLLNGTIFDSSYERKEPATFGVTQVIKGWVEGLQLMPVGSVWELYIPENLAYGEHPPGNIPAGATLIFKVELLSIEKKEDKKDDKK